MVCWSAATTVTGKPDVDSQTTARVIDTYLDLGGDPSGVAFAGQPLIAAIANVSAHGASSGVARLLAAGGSTASVAWDKPTVVAIMDAAVGRIPAEDRPSLLARILTDDPAGSAWAAERLAALGTSA